jgi:hypothetical protein
VEEEKEEGRRKKEEGIRKKEEGRRKKEEGRRKKEEGSVHFCEEAQEEVQGVASASAFCPGRRATN